MKKYKIKIEGQKESHKTCDVDCSNGEKLIRIKFHDVSGLPTEIILKRDSEKSNGILKIFRDQNYCRVQVLRTAVELIILYKDSKTEPSTKTLVLKKLNTFKQKIK